MIILDRDGVVNLNSTIKDSDLYYILKPENFFFKEGVLEAFRLMQKISCGIIMISKQRSISKGLATREQIQEVFNYMNFLIEENGGRTVTDIYIEEIEDSKVDLIDKVVSTYSFDCDEVLVIEDTPKTISELDSRGYKYIQIADENNLLNTIRTLIYSNFLEGGCCGE